MGIFSPRLSKRALEADGSENFGAKPGEKLLDEDLNEDLEKDLLNVGASSPTETFWKSRDKKEEN